MKASEKRSKRQKSNSFFTVLPFIVILLFHTSAAYAHKVYLFAWTEGDMIHTESYFGGNKKVQDGTIKVFDSEGKELLNGRTNEKGEFSFKVPQIADLKIVLESSMGHGAEYLFKRSEFSTDQVPAVEVTSDTNTVEEPEVPLQVTAGQNSLRKEFEATLDMKLKPIIRELAKLREDKGPGVTEIIGGIGYILGIMGIIAYMKSKNKKG